MKSSAPVATNAALTDARLKIVHLKIAGAVIAYGALYSGALTGLAKDWISDPDAGHALLLAPIAMVLAWRSGIRPESRAQPILGAVSLLGAVLLTCVAQLAAEVFTLRVSALAALLALLVCTFGWGQVRHWWLPCALLLLCIPLPDLVLSAAALPLQLRASAIGAALLEWRDVPVLLDGNIIHLPGHPLFVTEACSGLRSLSALAALGLLMGGMMLRHPAARVLVLVLAIPLAVLLNGLRVFLTGYLVFFIRPEFGTGFMHLTEGWLIFLVAFGILASLTTLIARAERIRWLH